MSPDGHDVVRLAIDNAVEVSPPAGARPEEEEDSDGRRRRVRDGDDGLPEGCPVTALGIDGDVSYYLDANRQLRALKAKDHSRLGVQSLFGSRIELLYDYWPRLDKDGNTTGWRPERAAERLMAAAARRGVWDALERVRGPGAWLGDRGELVLHVGDGVLICRSALDPRTGVRSTTITEVAPGAHERYVYPAAPAQPRPADRPTASGLDGPAGKVLSLLGTWSWRRGETDAMLLLGWIGAAMVGGALDWRPLAWITGDAGTGKSTLHKLLRGLFDGALLQASDSSAAGIWQTLGHAATPIALDELEAEEDNRRAQNIIKLARQAASGGVVLRGGADHQGSAFTARSCFLFSSILVPPLLNQDRSRMAILELDPLKGAVPPPLEPREMAELGRQLRRRLVDGWWRWQETLERWRQALAGGGHSGRGADQFGTLLAAADLLLYDEPPDSDTLESWAERLRAGAMSETDEAVADHERCVAHLVTQPAEVYRGGHRTTIGTLIHRAASDGEGCVDAREALGAYGIAVVKDHELRAKDWPRKGRIWVAVANSHQGLAQLFAGTHWAARSGASGVWVQALRRAAGAMPWGCMRFAGVPARCTLLPIDTVLPPEGAEEA